MPGRLLVSLALRGRPCRPPGDRRGAGPGPGPLAAVRPRPDARHRRAHRRLSADGHLDEPPHADRPSPWSSTSTRTTASRPATRLLLEKTLELLRLRPEYGIDRAGRQRRHRPDHARRPGSAAGVPLQRGQPDHDGDRTPAARWRAGESVTVGIEGTVHLPNKQGRWGQWDGVTFLANALPVVAYYDDAGWHATPFVPWHQPFWNEAGVYTATSRCRRTRCSPAPRRSHRRPTWATGGRRSSRTRSSAATSPSLCSADYQEYLATTRCPDGRESSSSAWRSRGTSTTPRRCCASSARRSRSTREWFGPFPYDQFTIAESFFGWNGNECAGLVMIDERVFDMPHLGPRVRRVPGLARDLPPVVVQPGRHQRLRRDVDGRGAGHLLHPPAARPQARQEQRPAGLAVARSSGCRTSTGRTTASASLYGAIRRDDVPAAAGECRSSGTSSTCSAAPTTAGRRSSA